MGRPQLSACCANQTSGRKKKKYEELNSFDLASFFSLSDKIMLLSPAARPSLHKHTSAFLLELKQVGI